MKADQIFQNLWADYQKVTPSAKRIEQILNARGDKIVNDHIALRTVNLPGVGIDSLSKLFIESDYVKKDTYIFEEKHLDAAHFELKGNPDAPKVFISELKLEEFSSFLQKTLTDCITKIPQGLINFGAIIYSGRTWGTISYKVYQKLRAESEYAAWLYTYGYGANHFTINVNKLKSVKNLRELIILLKGNGVPINISGGEVKGSKELMLEQASIMADRRMVEFKEGLYNIPTCYYEFAERQPKSNGKLFNGFIAKSADKIFESTNHKVA
jgi:hypothetical protein